MEIDAERCTRCVKCIPICPVGAIRLARPEKRVIVDQGQCVECGVCYRTSVCEVGALIRTELVWPRSLRAALSDPLIVHKETRIPGRGTEEMKTNDVTGRYKRGHIGLAAELGRPGIGTSLRDVEKVAMACAHHDVVFEPQNPITFLMVDQSTGQINPEVLNERVLSAIVEFEVELRKAPLLLADLRTVSFEIDTVFSLNAIGLVEPDGSVPAYNVLLAEGFSPSRNGKSNMGMGRPAFDFFGGPEQ